MDAKGFVVTLEGTTGKLGLVVSYDSVQDPKPIDNRLDELDCWLFVDLDNRGCFWPLSEFIDGDVELLLPYNSTGERPQDV
jgi:hypothetical protein